MTAMFKIFIMRTFQTDRIGRKKKKEKKSKNVQWHAIKRDKNFFKTISTLAKWKKNVPINTGPIHAFTQNFLIQ